LLFIAPNSEHMNIRFLPPLFLRDSRPASGRA
jgi:hypothetical protein